MIASGIAFIVGITVAALVIGIAVAGGEVGETGEA